MMMYIFMSFFCGIWVFSSNRKYLLMMLLSLEFIVLVLYFFLFSYLMLYNFELFFSMIFLTFSVCEGVLGLSILVSMIRSYGKDYFFVYNLLQC
uniref:NADH dehydrogenase subunit 4L n=1 Tax=Pseudoglomeris planiuscula TaxID=3036352 RepID=UPI00279F98A0|nr:NADH dehydrogenase subunit 4L [Pseudoglomeris planiuscula]WGO57544.1 NADH dehydrogenase subunit 4L [Pseudoglomeris planiuscula]